MRRESPFWRPPRHSPLRLLCGDLMPILAELERRQTGCPKPHDQGFLLSRRFGSGVSKPASQHARSFVGQLLWLSVISRPDIAYVTTYLARFSAKGTQEHFNAALRVIAHLQATANYGITYSRESTGHLREHIISHSSLKEYPFSKNTIITFTDSSHGGERPMAGYVGFLAGGPMAWAAYRLTVTPLSSCQGEYHGATKAAVMTKAYNDTLSFVGFPTQGAAPIFCDNRAAVLLSESDISTKKLLLRCLQ